MESKEDSNGIVELWDVCLSFEYDKETLLKGLTKFLLPFRDKKILDCACGTGFLTLDLIKQGFDITCSDGSEGMLKKFRENAEAMDVHVTPQKLKWQELKDHFPEKFDLVMCRGSSLIYDGAWEKEKEPSEQSIYEALSNFFQILKPGGVLYVDTTSEENLEKDNPEENEYASDGLQEKGVSLQEKVEVNKGKKIRTWQPKIKQGDHEHSLVRYSQYMPHEELFKYLKEIGFSQIQKEEIEGEHYDVFTARKSGLTDC